MLFADRADAGRFLAGKLRDLATRDCVVLGLARGGMPVAAEVATALDAPLDVFVVRKLGVPQSPELAFGAIASGGARVILEETVRELGLSSEQIEEVERAERAELARRETLYRGGRPPAELTRKTVVLVDDGLATGASMTAAARAIRSRGAERLIVAVPVGAPETCSQMRREADDVVCAATPSPFYSVGSWYERFEQTSDEEVRRLLEAAVPAARTHGAKKKSLTLDGALVVVENDSDYAPLVDLAARRRFILIGEATHGTHEFYRDRIELTKALIERGLVRAVAAEADWPDAYRVNRFVLGRSDDRDAEAGLADFKRFPAWMWRNEDVLGFVSWLKAYNVAHPAAAVGFFGLDLYSMNASREAVVAYLDEVDPAAAKRARRRYACFDRFDGEAERYAAARWASESCEKEALDQLLEMSRRRAETFARDGVLSEDASFYAEQNALLVKNAERYYRVMLAADEVSWNVRDRHMAETLERVADHLGRRTPGAKIVVWEHNSHLGDARATQFSQEGQLNVGQLARERWGDDVFSIGFTTYSGHVTAARDWGGLAERRIVRPASAGSYEALFHTLGAPRFFLTFPPPASLDEPRLERAIGVVYRPETERFSHYFTARLSKQFDAVIHVDKTTALRPLERASEWERGEAPETFPSAL
jgi:erythromycin esterase-like protein/predicted phosphoribosyltransferase